MEALLKRTIAPARRATSSQAPRTTRTLATPFFSRQQASPTLLCLSQLCGPACRSALPLTGLSPALPLPTVAASRARAPRGRRPDESQRRRRPPGCSIRRMLRRRRRRRLRPRRRKSPCVVDCRTAEAKALLPKPNDRGALSSRARPSVVWRPPAPLTRPPAPRLAQSSRKRAVPPPRRLASCSVAACRGRRPRVSD